MLSAYIRELTMLDKFKKFFNTTAEAVQPKEVTQMTTETAQADLSVVTNTAEMSALVAKMASQSETLLSIQNQFAELTAKYEQAQAALSVIESEKASLQAAAKAKVQAERKTKLEATVGTEKASAILASLESLDDSTFEAVVGAMAASFETEAKSKMFTEAGVEATVAVVEVDPVKSLATKLEKQFKSK